MRSRRELLGGLERAVFRTITDADWRREIAASRGAKNPVQLAVNEKILAVKLGKIEPDAVGKINRGNAPLCF